MKALLANHYKANRPSYQIGAATLIITIILCLCVWLPLNNYDPKASYDFNHWLTVNLALSLLFLLGGSLVLFVRTRILGYCLLSVFTMGYFIVCMVYNQLLDPEIQFIAYILYAIGGIFAILCCRYTFTEGVKNQSIQNEWSKNEIVEKENTQTSLAKPANRFSNGLGVSAFCLGLLLLIAMWFIPSLSEDFYKHNSDFAWHFANLGTSQLLLLGGYMLLFTRTRILGCYFLSTAAVGCLMVCCMYLDALPTRLEMIGFILLGVDCVFILAGIGYCLAEGAKNSAVRNEWAKTNSIAEQAPQF